MKKRSIIVAMTTLMMVPAVTGCTSKAANSDSTFTPKETIDWTVTSSPGGGSDIYTRTIFDIMAKENLVSGQPIIVTNKTDGSGKIGGSEVATTRGSKADYTLPTFNSGDLVPMIQNTENRSSNSHILAIMAVDKQPIFRGEQTKYTDFREAIEATKNGTKIVIGDSGGDDIAAYDAILGEIGISRDVMSYVTCDSTGDTITAAPGGHVEFVISGLAAASEYVTAGSLIPVLALSMECYTGNLADAPTLSEIGDYENVEAFVWHGVAALAAMSDAAATYWSKQLSKVTKTDTWRNDYSEKNGLIGNYTDAAGAAEYVAACERDFMAADGIQ